MDPLDLLRQFHTPLLFLLAFGIGANDAATGMATAAGSGALPLRVAMVAGAVAAAIPVLLLATPTLDAAAGPALQAAVASPEHAAAAVLAILLATVLAMLAWSALGQPMPAVLMMAAGAVGVALAQGRMTGAEFGLLGVVGAVVVAVPAVAAGLALGGEWWMRRRLHDFWRPRDRLAGLVAVVAGLTAALTAAVPAVAFDLGVGTSGLPLWVPAALAAAGLAFGYAAMRQSLAGAPFWVSNDPAGIDRAHRRLAVAGSLVLAFAFGGAQAAAVTIAAGLLLLSPTGPGAGMRLDPSSADWIGIMVPLTLGLIAGVLLLGFRTTRRVGSTLAALTEARAAVANLAAGAALLLAGVLGVSMPGGSAAAGAVAGIGLADGTAEARRPLAVVIALWILGVPLAAALAAGLYLGLGLLAG